MKNSLHSIINRVQLKFQRRILVVFIPIIIICLSLFGYLLFGASKKILQSEVERINQRLAVITSKEISNQYDEIIRQVDRLSQGLALNDASALIQVRSMIELRLYAPQIYQALYLFDENDNLIIYLEDPLTDLLSAEKQDDMGRFIDREPILVKDEIKEALNSTRNDVSYISPIKIVGADQMPTMFIVRLINQGENHDKKHLVAEIDLRDIWRKVDEIYFGETGHAYIVSAEGIIIAHPDRSYIGQHIDPVLAGALLGYEGYTDYIDLNNGKVMIASYSPVSKQSGWGIIVEQELSEALVPITKIAYITYTILAIAILITVLLSMLIAQNITKPIKDLVAVTNKIEHTQELNQRVNINRKDEVGQLSITFNQMIGSLEESNNKLIEYSENLESMVEERTKELGDAQEQLVRKERLAVLGELAGSVGHELRNPLAVISNSIYFLNSVTQEDEVLVKEYLNIISEQVIKSDKIINDLLNFARLQKVEKETVSAKELINDVISADLLPPDIEVSVEYPDNVPQLYIDRKHIEQVLTNLVTNANDAMHGVGTLSIKVSKGDSKVRISITDTGDGISDENLKKIFQPLFTTKTKGIGLGLAVTLRLVEANGGEINVVSKVGKGSTFTLDLPTYVSSHILNSKMN